MSDLDPLQELTREMTAVYSTGFHVQATGSTANRVFEVAVAVPLYWRNAEGVTPNNGYAPTVEVTDFDLGEAMKAAAVKLRELRQRIG